MNLKSKKLSTKLIVPITASIIILSIILIATIWYYQKINKEYVIQKDIASFEKLIDNNIERLGNQGVYIASIMASLDTVKSIYRAYHAGADFIEISNAMANPVNSMVESIKTNLGITPKLHFHVAPGQSFYRSWSDKRGDDISSFRSSVKDAINLKKPIKGIEIGRGGFVVRGIVPILDNGNVLGSVECYFSMKEVMEYTKLSAKEEIAIFMDTTLLDIATGFANTTNINKENKTIGHLIEFDKTSNKFNINALSTDTMNMAFQTKMFFENDNYVYVLTPIKNYKGENQGVGVIQMDITDTNKTFSHLTNSILVIGSITLFILGFLVSFLIKKIVSKPIEQVNVAMENMSNGLLTKEIVSNAIDEVGNMVKSLNKLIARNKETAIFAKNIESGNFEAEFRSLSNEDLIGNALLEMRSSLSKAKIEEEKRRDEEKKQQWQTQGMATFGELLREFDNDLEQFSFKIISNLVKYLNVEQGGLFVLNEENTENPFLELKSTFAYDRRKFMEKRIEIGEGLIGACLYEKQAMYLIDIPKNYAEITSGLGKSTPKALYIAPLKVNDDIFGIIEIASLKEIEEYKREFIDKVCESIGSALSTVRVNQKTKELLEASQIQERQLAEQEEEMRQNMEELQATQEESYRRESQLQEELKQALEIIEKLKTGIEVEN